MDENIFFDDEEIDMFDEVERSEPVTFEGETLGIMQDFYSLGARLSEHMHVVFRTHGRHIQQVINLQAELAGAHKRNQELAAIIREQKAQLDPLQENVTALARRVEELAKENAELTKRLTVDPTR